jgi:hypothetical protein
MIADRAPHASIAPPGRYPGLWDDRERVGQWPAVGKEKEAGANGRQS